MDLPTFRQLYPEFSDPAFPPDIVVNHQLSVATARLDPNIWGALIDEGLGLFMAHRCALWARDQNALAAQGPGGVTGEVKGPVTARSVDKVSSSYDSNAVIYEGAGYWNLTRYGIQFWELAQTFHLAVQL